MSEIKIIPPVKIDTDSPYYKLIITDATGVIHYFNEDGSYDGWSKETNINEN